MPVTNANNSFKTAVKAFLGVALLLVFAGVFTLYFDSLLFAVLLTVLLAVGWLYRRYKRDDPPEQATLEDYDAADE